jgi:hypothetical protein
MLPTKPLAVANAEPEILSPAAEQETLEREKLEGKRVWQLYAAAQGHVDLAADVSPIFALIDQG